MSAPALPADGGLAAFVRSLPKVELHVHLEGAMRPETLLALAQRHRQSLPASDLAGLREWFRFRDFEHFVEVYLACSRCLRAPEDFARLIDDFLAEQAREGVRASEAHFTISTHVSNGANPEELLDAMAAAITAGERRYGVRLRLIPDIVRNVGIAPADLTLEWALAGAARGVVVALGLSGSEARFGAAPFAEHFVAAARTGLHCVAHAGEHRGADSIREVLEHCRPERLGHGVRAVEDPALVAELAARRLPLEICPTSNVRLGVVADYASHPIAALRAAGVPLSVSSDDPPLFGTTVCAEYLQLASAFGWGAEVLVALVRAGIEQSFLPAAERALLCDELDAAAAAGLPAVAPRR